MKISNNFEVLENEQLDEVNGGGAFLIAVGVSIVGCFVFDVINEKVERDTGKSLVNHCKDAVIKAIDSF